jgi:hypothetical protein
MLGAKEGAILVVVSFLFVILICSSVTKFNAVALRKHFTTEDKCVSTNTGPNPTVRTFQCCHNEWDEDNGVVSNQVTMCKDCYQRGDGEAICGDYYVSSSRQPPAGTNNPPVAGAEQPPPPQPPKSVLPPSSITCPHGPTPDANGNCPTSTTNQQIAPPSEHHHKGSNNLLGGESTTKKSKNDNGNSQSVP